MHISCHSRAQNIGQKATELLKLVPELKVDVIERCSGHGGSWGIKKENFKMAIKVGKPVARKVVQFENVCNLRMSSGWFTYQARNG